MLTQERYSVILNYLENKKAATVLELAELLDTSESTIRRDLTALHNEGKLRKVHGGATALPGSYRVSEPAVSEKYGMNAGQKKRIARYAASLIRGNEFVYLDAGTTTEAMAEYIQEKNAVYVTNGIHLAKKLAQRNFQVFVPAGRIKGITEAITGNETVSCLQRFHFTKGFFGANGVHLSHGFTTPDVDEARTKTEAFRRCRERFVLADESKFGLYSSVSFASLGEAEIITTLLADKDYLKYTSIREVDRT